MSARLWIVTALTVVVVIGAIRIVAAVRRLLAEQAEVEGYLHLLNGYLQNQDDPRAYGMLIERSYRIQGLLGFAGILGHYVAPFGAYSLTNYPIILNGVPAMRRDHERGISRSDYQPMVAEALVRYLGLSADRILAKQRDLRNPIVWLREGVAGVLLCVPWLLQGLGLGSASRTAAIAGSAGLRVLSGILALIGLVGSIITIVLGWEQTLRALHLSVQ